jgi:hypothetical protein
MLDQMTEALARRVADLVLERLAAGEMSGWIDQHKSPLGRRRHINIARVEGRQVGRRYFLPVERVERAMSELTAKKRAIVESDVERAMSVAPIAGT